MKKVLFVFMMMALVLSACGGAPAAAPNNEPAAEEAAPAAEEVAEEPAAEEAAPAADGPEACSADEFGCAVIPEGETIKIGMGAPLLGDYSMFGVDISQGASLAIDTPEFEGWAFELVAEDTGGSAEGGAAVANKMVTDPTVVAIAGHIFSGSRWVRFKSTMYRTSPHELELLQ